MLRRVVPMSNQPSFSPQTPLIPSNCVVIDKDTLLEVLELCRKLAEFVVKNAGQDFLSEMTSQFGPFGEAHFCCHYSNPISPNTVFCKSHTSYSAALAKAWCIANTDGSSGYDHLQKG